MAVPILWVINRLFLVLGILLTAWFVDKVTSSRSDVVDSVLIQSSSFSSYPFCCILRPVRVSKSKCVVYLIMYNTKTCKEGISSGNNSCVSFDVLGNYAYIRHVYDMCMYMDMSMSVASEHLFKTLEEKWLWVYRKTLWWAPYLKYLSTIWSFFRSLKCQSRKLLDQSDMLRKGCWALKILRHIAC